MANFTIPRWFGVGARVLFAALMLLTSVYCLLAYIPDTYFAFIQAPFQFWVVKLIQLHAYFFCGLVAAVAATMLQQYSSGVARRMAVQFAVVNGIAGIYFLAVRPFSHVTNNSLSFVWSVAALFPVIWIAVIDYTGPRQSNPGLQWPQPPQVRIGAALLAALGIGVLYPASAWLRTQAAGRAMPLDTIDFLAWGWALLLHTLFALFVIAGFNLAGAIAFRFRQRWVIAFLIYNGTIAAGVALVFSRVLLPSIPLIGPDTIVYSVVIAIALVLFLGSLMTSTSTAVVSASRAITVTEKIALLLVAAGAMYTVPALIGVMDWNSILAKLWAAVVWIGVLAVIARIWQPARRVTYPVGIMMLCAVSSYGAYRVVEMQSAWAKLSPVRQVQIEDALSRHSSFDASYDAVHELWAVSDDKPCDPFCQFLHQQTGIPPWIAVQPVDTKLVDTLTPTSGPKPNIFIIVVDSLRRDYLSPYNPAVQFTPEIARFADESVVMRNSFTRYSGTTLSEPAIWAGSMMLHKHYVQPFHPMNNLEKLVETDGYDRFISVDTVLRLLLKSSAADHRLDSWMTNWSDQDFCRTAPEAEEMIDHRTATTRPIFLYTQPQNIHVVALERAKAVRPPQDIYPGFNASAATEIKRLDGCFGQFVHYLKARGIYDNSIVVLTADHGESYGEFGHHNHAFGLTPEALRIPLIVHLPESMRKNYYADTQAVAFNTDLTPSLYYMLGHRPVVNDPRFGRPLFTLTAEEHDKYVRDSYLVAVCYGPIYGLLGRNGDDLFIANEMDDTYSYFDLAHDPNGIHNLVDGKVIATDQPVIHADVQNIADLYHYRYQEKSLLSWIMR